MHSAGIRSDLFRLIATRMSDGVNDGNRPFANVCVEAGR